MGAGDQRRACDVCGADEWKFSQLTPIGNDKWACPYDSRGLSDADMEGLTPFQLKPPVESRPGEQVRETSVIPLYQKAEAEVFNLLVAYKGAGVPPHRWVLMGRTGQAGTGGIGAGDGSIVTSDADVALDVVNWTAIYLYELLHEDSRPNQWTAPAIAQFRTMVDTLLANQLGSSTVRAAITTDIGTVTAADLGYGGIGYIARYTGTNNGGTGGGSGGLHDEGPWEWDGSTGFGRAICFTATTLLAGTALLRAYQYFGDKKYRDGYLRVATFAQRAMRADLLTNGAHVDHSGGAYRTNMWPTYVQQNVGNTAAVNNIISPEGIIGLEFLTLLKAQEGDIQIGDATICTDLATQPPLLSISDAIAAIKAAWIDGVVAQSPQETDNDIPPVTKRTAFGAITYERLRVGLGGGFFRYPRWEFIHEDNQQPYNTIFGMTYAYAMRGWYAAFGFDSTLEAMWNFFAATTTGSDYTNPAATPREIVRQSAMGTYVPGDVGLAQAICVEHQSTYARVNFLCDDCAMGIDWGTVGVLADLWVARNPAGFAKAKATMSTRQRAREGIEHNQEFYAPVLLRYTGVGLQPFPIIVTTHPTSSADVIIPSAYLKSYLMGGTQDPNLIGNYHPRALDALGAAMAGLAYRRQPKIYAVRDRPPH